MNAIFLYGAAAVACSHNPTYPACAEILAPIPAYEFWIGVVGVAILLVMLFMISWPTPKR
jgi:hypothetical protein